MTPELMGNKSDETLAGIIQRIEDLESERAQASEKIKAEYAMAEGAGFDKKAIRQIVKDRRADLQKTIEFRAVVESYRKALARRMGNALGELGEWARSWVSSESKMGLEGAKDEYKRFDADLDRVLKKKPPKGGDKDDGEAGREAAP